MYYIMCDYIMKSNLHKYNYWDADSYLNMDKNFKNMYLTCSPTEMASD